MASEHNDCMIDLEPISYNPFSGPEIIKLIPTIEPQLEIWSACVIGGEDASRSYNESTSLLLRGAFDCSAFQNALSDLVARHEALRCSFSADGSQICVYRDLVPTFLFEDITNKTPEEQQQHLVECSRKDANTVFDLLNGPLFRIFLFKLGAAEHCVTLTTHHIICDGWSVAIMMEDLSRLYNNHKNPQKVNLPEPIPFSKYAGHEWEFSKSAAYQQIEQYWLGQYRDNVPVLNLPTDYPRPSVRTYKSHRIDFPMDPVLAAAVKKLGTSYGCSLVTTMLAAFEVLLHRLTGQEDIVLGVPAAGQSVTGNYYLIGHCVNLLPLRSHPEDHVPFSEYLKKRKSQILNDYDQQQITFGSLLKKLNIERDPSRVPLVPVVFNIDMGMDDGVRFDGLTHRMFSNPREYESFEIFLNVTGSEQAFVLEWSYNTQLFNADSIKRMMSGYEALLQEVLSDPDLSIGELKMFTPPNKEDLLRDHSSRDFAYPRDKTIVDLITEQARKKPQNIAIEFGDQQLSYRELEERSNQLGHYLRSKGVMEDDLVPICMDRSLDMIIGILGILKAGGAYVPIDPEYPEERIKYILTDTSARLMLSDGAVERKNLVVGPELELIRIDKSSKEISRQSVEEVKNHLKPDHLAYVIYTSGSTGRPKGVMIEHLNVVRLFKTESPLFDFNADDVWTMFHSFCFDFSVWEMYGALFYGGKLILVPREVAMDARLFGKLLIGRRVTVLNQTPAAFYVLQDVLAGEIQQLSVRYVIFGGEALNPTKLGPWKTALPGCKMINMYGITETTVHVTYQEILAEHIRSKTSVIGRPIPTLYVYILNDKRHVVPVGVPGELYVGGMGLARGYLNLPELTLDRFIRDPFSNNPKARLYKTGDLAKILPDGNIEYLGRMDDQVKIRGYRIELGEIEHALQQCAGIKQSVVLVGEDTHVGKYLVGYVVTGGSFSKDKAMTYLRKRLPEYMIPTALLEIDQIPLTSSGKIDRKKLSGSLRLADLNQKKDSRPRSASQELVAAIMAEALGISDVDLNDDFFELGGNSLVAIQVMKRLEEKTGKRLPIITLFEASTVEKLSKVLDSDSKGISSKTLVPIKPGGSKPPLYIIHGSGLTVMVFNSLAKGMDADQPVYGIQARGLNGEDPLDRMEDIAAFYIAEILEQNPTGPYCLAGYSFGGKVAFEMARQLTAMGKEIRTLAIFDTYADNPDHDMSLVKRVGKKMMRQVPKMRFIWNSFKERPGETWQYQLDFVKRKGRTILEKMGWIEAEKTEEEALTVYAKKINEKHFHAYRNYRITKYDGAIDVFRVQKRLYYLEDPEFLGWKPYAAGGVKIHIIPGDHKTFLMPPNDKYLAMALKDALNERMKEYEEGKQASV